MSIRTCCGSDEHKPHSQSCERRPTEEINVASVGFGRQSTALCELSAAGEISPTAVGFFADTQVELPETYEFKDKVERRWPFKVYAVSKGNLEKDLLGAREKYGYQRVNIPAWTLDKDGKTTPFSRGCTFDYKIQQVRKAVRGFLGFTKKKVTGVCVNMQIGMSVDEPDRMRDSKVYWIRNRYPLIFEKPLSAQRCSEILVERGAGNPPKSACFFCPYSSNERWRHLKNEHPSYWKRAVHLDEAIRNSEKAEHTLYLHRSRTPLEKADLTEQDSPQLNLFRNDCSGMCGA